MNVTDLVAKTIRFPQGLITRYKAIRTIYPVKFAQVATDGLEAKIIELEKKHQDDLAREKAIRDAKEERKNARSRRSAVGGLGTLKAFTPFPMGAEKAAAPASNYADDELYERAARTLLGVSSADEAKKRAKNAVEIVQTERRLTAPSESEILARIEENFLRLRGQKAPETRTYDDLVGAIVNLDKMKTVGALVDDDGSVE